jgi:hypothetical protein
MEVHIAPESRAALKAHSTIRCLFRTRFKLDSRLSGPVIAWANSLANTFCEALLEDIGQKAAVFDKQMLMVVLSREHALICYDIFLEECSELVRIDIGRSTKQPIHEIRKKGNVYQVRRSKNLDAIVSAEYKRMQGLDKGPQPYFSDSMDPPVYDNGVRLEGFRDGEEEKHMLEGKGVRE